MSNNTVKLIARLSILIFLIFTVEQVLARGRGGGGGFSRSGSARSGQLSGSASSKTRSFNSSGSARSGSLSSRRTSDRSSRSAQGASQVDRSQLQTQRGGVTTQRKTTAEDLQTSRQGFKEENREDWQEYGKGRQEDREDVVRDIHEDREDYLEHHDNHNYWGYHHDNDWEEAVAFAVGVTLTAAAIRSLTCTMSAVTIDGITYYQCGPTWYQRTYQGGNVVHVVINPPHGY